MNRLGEDIHNLIDDIVNTIHKTPIVNVTQDTVLDSVWVVVSNPINISIRDRASSSIEYSL